MSERRYFCFCEANCKFETMTKEQILAAIAQAVESGEVHDVDAGFVTKVKEANAGGYVTFWVGTTAQYNALPEKDPSCMYIFTDGESTAELQAAVKKATSDAETAAATAAEANATATAASAAAEAAQATADEAAAAAAAAAPASHNHAASNITSGTLGVARGGTGAATHTANAVLTGNGTSAVNNVATASGALYATAANGAAKFGILPIAQGGTGSSNGATGLKNLFAKGNTILSSYQYGDSLPTSGFTAGRIFFKKVGS